MVDIASLSKYSLFGALMPEEIGKIVPLLGSEAYEAGQVIIGEGSLNGCIRFVLEGRIEVSRDGVRLNEIGEGDTFGEMEILDVMPAVANCRALTQVRVATISNKTLHDIFHLDAHARHHHHEPRPRPLPPTPAHGRARGRVQEDGSALELPRAKTASYKTISRQAREGSPGDNRNSY